MKTSKTALKDAVRSLISRIDWVTGGTREENIAQAPGAVEGLQKLADEIDAMLANAGKRILEDADLVRSAKSAQYRIAAYKFRYLGGPCPAKFEGLRELHEGDRIAPLSMFPEIDVQSANLNVVEFPAVEVQAAVSKPGEPIPTPREQMAKDLEAEFPKLAINETGVFRGKSIFRQSAKLYVMQNPNGKAGDMLRMTKRNWINWYNTAPIVLGGRLRKPDGGEVPATVEVDAKTGDAGKVTEAAPSYVPEAIKKDPRPQCPQTAADAEARRFLVDKALTDSIHGDFAVAWASHPDLVQRAIAYARSTGSREGSIMESGPGGGFQFVGARVVRVGQPKRPRPDVTGDVAAYLQPLIPGQGDRFPEIGSTYVILSLREAEAICDAIRQAYSYKRDGLNGTETATLECPVYLDTKGAWQADTGKGMKAWGIEVPYGEPWRNREYGRGGKGD